MQGHIRKRVHTTKDGRQTVNWYVVVDLPRDRNGKRRQKWHGGFGTRKEAEAARAKIVHEMNLGTYVEPSSTTLSQWVHEHWLPTIETRVKPSTFDSYRRNLELHVLPRLGNRQLRQLTPAMLNTMYADLLGDGHRKTEGGLGAKTVRYIHTIVHKVLADAVDSGLIAANVASRAKPPRPRATAPSAINFWEPDELRAFLEIVRGHRLEAAWHVAAMAGMRRGEVLGLRWKDIDLEAARVSVRQALVSVAYEVFVATPKTHQARVIDLDAGFERLVARSDLPKIRLHDLRHTHATIAIKAGVPVKVISERLGHETPAFTLKQYAHVVPGMQAEAAQVIAALVESLSPTGLDKHDAIQQVWSARRGTPNYLRDRVHSLPGRI